MLYGMCNDNKLDIWSKIEIPECSLDYTRETDYPD